MSKGLHKQRGITLLELLIASALLASILVISERSISSARKSAQVVEQRSTALRDLDRVWILLENDLRNIVAAPPKIVQFSAPLLPLRIDRTDEYLMSVLRAGQANPLLLQRTEVLRVGYRVQEEVLWRDSWVDPYNPDPETARQQQLLEGVEEVRFTALPRAPLGRSVSAGPWLETWPDSQVAQSPNAATLPLAIEITLVLKKRGELRRLIALAPGA